MSGKANVEILGSTLLKMERELGTAARVDFCTAKMGKDFMSMPKTLLESESSVSLQIRPWLQSFPV
jgi:hypothetical protein